MTQAQHIKNAVAHATHLVYETSMSHRELAEMVLSYTPVAYSGILLAHLVAELDDDNRRHFLKAYGTCVEELLRSSAQAWVSAQSTLPKRGVGWENMS